MAKTATKKTPTKRKTADERAEIAANNARQKAATKAQQERREAEERAEVKRKLAWLERLSTSRIALYNDPWVGQRNASPIVWGKLLRNALQALFIRLRNHNPELLEIPELDGLIVPDPTSEN